MIAVAFGLFVWLSRGTAALGKDTWQDVVNRRRLCHGGILLVGALLTCAALGQTLFVRRDLDKGARGCVAVLSVLGFGFILVALYMFSYAGYFAISAKSIELERIGGIAALDGWLEGVCRSSGATRKKAISSMIGSWGSAMMTIAFILYLVASLYYVRMTDEKGDYRKKGLRNLGHNLATDFRRNTVLYVMAIPILAWFILFRYVPMGGLLMAFEDFSITKGIFGSEFVGLKWFKQFFDSMYFGRLIRNTLLLGVLDVLIAFPIPILFALLLNEIRNRKFKKITQTVSYMPYFISTVVVCGIIVDFTEANGLISNLVSLITGNPSANLLGQPSAFRSIFIGSNIWQLFGYNSIIYIAAISGVDQELYEAAMMDGCGRLRQTWHITLPGIALTIIIMLILRMGSLLTVGGEKVLLLYRPATYETADVLSSYIYRLGMEEAQYDYTTAIGMFNSVINTLLLLTTNAISKRVSSTSLF